jgi:hypothetical protein
MNDLLTLAVDAHGGLNRWNRLSTVRSSMSITGALGLMKGKPDVLSDIRVEAQLHTERIIIYQPRLARRMSFMRRRVMLETDGGELLAARDNPRAAFDGQTRESAWDDLHVGYFCGYSLWTYLTTPFLYTAPGFTTEELAPWMRKPRAGGYSA